MRRLVTFPLLILLAACGTPQERCIARETRELRTLDRLIKESEANLKRGYALEEVVVYDQQWVLCPAPPPPPPPADGSAAPAPAPQPTMCLRNVRDTEVRPKAINLKDEAEKLASMQDKRKELALAAQPGVAQCKKTYPE